jgi:cyclophilin family peptidyl-prolyl cis-trans isomerase/HEAT repeat protein
VKGILSILSLTLLSWNTLEQKHPNKYADPILIRIADLSDRRLPDSLYRFFKSSNPNYRREAVAAFASIKDSTAAQALGKLLLEDENSAVRKSAAFSLGQTGSAAGADILKRALADKDHFVVREVLEALGKTIRKSDRNIILNYSPSDSLSEEGLAWAIYRLGVRGLADSAFIPKVTQYLRPGHSFQSRFATASFFGRSALVNPTAEKVLIETALNDPRPEVRMAAVSGLRKSAGAEVVAAFKAIAQTEKDSRVRANLTRSLRSLPPEVTRPLLLKLLADENANVGIAASEAIDNTIKGPWPELEEIANHQTDWRIQANLYKIVLARSYSKTLATDLKSLYERSKNVYQKAWLINALSADVASFSFIAHELLETNVFVIKSAAAEALVDINHNKNFPVDRQPELILVYRKAIVAGDPAVVGILCAALSDPELKYKEVIRDFGFLYEAKAKMKLPKDIESLQPLDEALAYFEGKAKPLPLKNEFNHPIDWALVKTIPVGQKATIKTTKGDITIQLFVEEAPGSVANFVNLIRQTYFDGKYFHRVVPNFVVQGGCNRGDGFGSEDYSIRSEFSGRPYSTGSVGMASAGKDTEGTQWFITHSPTPHLTGNYTIFAEVIGGMETVQGVDVGDQITTVTLMK